MPKRMPFRASKYCAALSDSEYMGKLIPPWLQHLLCACIIKRKRKGCGTDDNHVYWLNFDACGMICATMVYLLVFYCDFALMAHVLWPWFGLSFWGVLHGSAFNLLAALALLSHMRAMLSNPGAVPFSANPTEAAGWERRCQRCDNFKPSRAHHCSICNRCVVKMGECRCLRGLAHVAPAHVHVHCRPR
jgi:hypothetical protein